MPRIVLLLVAVLALTASACGDIDPETLDVTTSDTSAADDLALSEPIDTADGGADTTTTAAPETTDSTTSTAATTDDPSPEPGTSGDELIALAAAHPPESFRLRLTTELHGLAGVAGESLSFSMDAAFSDDGRSGEVEMDMSALAGLDVAGADAEALSLMGDSLSMKFIDDVTYISSGFLAFMFPVETPWIGMTEESASSPAGVAPETVSTDDFLGVLRSVDPDARIVGTETLDGVETTHVAGTVSAASLAADGNEAFLEELDISGGLAGFTAEVLDIEVWIGDDGIVRRMAFGVDDMTQFDPTAPAGAAFGFVIDITGIGEPVVVEAPPADQVTWMDDLMGGFFGADE